MNEKYLYENIDNKKVKELIDRIPNDIKKNCKLKEFEKGKIVVLKENNIKSMYLHCKGEMKVRNEFENGFVYDFAVIKPISYIGAMEIMANKETYSSTLQATTDSMIIEIPKNDFINWMKLREITYYIKKIRNTEEVIIKERSKSFEHKCKNKEDIMLANKLIKSTADYYVNKAISVLKEEKLKGREEECLEILQKIFMET